MFRDDDGHITLKNFYGITKPDPKHMKERMKKVAVVIDKMGDKYCLAIPVEKKQ